MYKLQKKKNFFLLWIVFFHVLGCFFSCFYDKSSHSQVKLTKPTYWFWFFTYWSAWTSLVTITWALYWLFNQKKQRGENFKKQLIDIAVMQTNLISGFVFCAGGFWLTYPKKNSWELINYLPFSLLLRCRVYKLFPWLLYNYFWHVLSPILVIYFWWFYCHVNLLKKREIFYNNLVNPSVYFVYIISRPKLKIMKWNLVNKNKLPYEYPYDYPYSPFYWCSGEKASKNDNHFWLSGKWAKNIWLTRLLWTLITINFWFLVFSLLLYFSIKIKEWKYNKNHEIQGVFPAFLDMKKIKKTLYKRILSINY